MMVQEFGAGADVACALLKCFLPRVFLAKRNEEAS